MFFLQVDGVYFCAAHRGDVFFFPGTVHRFFPGRKCRAFLQGEASCRFLEGNDHVGIVRLGGFRHGVQDVFQIEFGQRGKAAVERPGNACVVFQIGKQQGKRRFGVAALFGLPAVTVDILPDGGHGAEHLVPVPLVRSGQGSFQKA